MIESQGLPLCRNSMPIEIRKSYAEHSFGWEVKYLQLGKIRVRLDQRCCIIWDTRRNA